jgi:outer membrane protein TolC
MMKRLVQYRRMSAARCALATAALLGLLTGCTVGPKYSPPATVAPPLYKESPSQFKETGGWQVAQPGDAALRGKWWEIFNDPELNALEDQLNIDNQNIRQAFENFMEARAMVREARSQYFPTVSVGGAYTRSEASSNVSQASSNAASAGATATRPAIATVFTSRRCLLGARPLGTGPQCSSRQPIHRPIDRGRS